MATLTKDNLSPQISHPCLGNNAHQCADGHVSALLPHLSAGNPILVDSLWKVTGSVKVVAEVEGIPKVRHMEREAALPRHGYEKLSYFLASGRPKLFHTKEELRVEVAMADHEITAGCAHGLLGPYFLTQRCSRQKPPSRTTIPAASSRSRDPARSACRNPGRTLKTRLLTSSGHRR